MKKILLVDDYDADNFLHRMVIEKYGCAEIIEICRNGSEALDYIKAGLAAGESLPDLIFLDINMPVMNGWEFLEAYEGLTDGRSGGTVVAMLTTSLNPDDRARAEKSADVKYFAYKPLTADKLTEILTKFYPESVRAD